MATRRHTRPADQCGCVMPLSTPRATDHQQLVVCRAPNEGDWRTERAAGTGGWAMDGWTSRGQVPALGGAWRLPLGAGASPVDRPRGPMVAGTSEQISRFAVEAAMGAGVRAVVLGGWAALAPRRPCPVGRVSPAHAAANVLLLRGSLAHEDNEGGAAAVHHAGARRRWRRSDDCGIATSPATRLHRQDAQPPPPSPTRRGTTHRSPRSIAPSARAPTPSRVDLDRDRRRDVQLPAQHHGERPSLVLQPPRGCDAPPAPRGTRPRVRLCRRQWHAR